MADLHHLYFLNQGRDVWNKWRQENTEIQPDLSIANLMKANLNDIDLTGANLSGTNLNGAILTGALLNGALLNGANLGGANLGGAILIGAFLSGADLSRANLSRANLSRASLRKDYEYTDAVFIYTESVRTNLREALQLHLFGGSLPDGHLGEDLLRLSERRHVGLEGSSHLLQSVNGEMLRVAQSVFVAVTMDAAIGHPTGPAFVARGAETPLASQKAERGECRQPVKPLRGVRGQ